jgi:hypothetical protein
MYSSSDGCKLNLWLTEFQHQLTVLKEYLSKPLKQNQLIQTILKCATLGGALLEHSHVTPTDSGDDRGIPHTPTKDLNGIPLNGISRRPPLELRANTEVGLGGSPSIVTADQADPLSVRAYIGNMLQTLTKTYSSF